MEKEILKEFVSLEKTFSLLEKDKIATDKQIDSVLALASRINDKLAISILKREHFSTLITSSEDILKTAYGTKTIEKIAASYFIDKNGKFFNVKIADLVKILNELLKADSNFKKEVAAYKKEEAKA